VVEHHLGDDLQPTLVRLPDEGPEIPEGAVVRMHSLVVGDIVATVLERGWVVRQEPDRRDAEVLEVVELLRQSGEIADPVAVAVVERTDVQLVDDRVLVPEGRRWLVSADRIRGIISARAHGEDQPRSEDRSGRQRMEDLAQRCWGPLAVIRLVAEPQLDTG
jgi:hypothetical protein